MKRKLTTVSCIGGAPNLIVLLPGAYMTPEDFECNGFFDAVARRRLALDVIAVDLDLSAISGGSAVRDLHSMIIEPGRKNGYQKNMAGRHFARRTAGARLQRRHAGRCRRSLPAGALSGQQADDQRYRPRRRPVPVATETR